MGIREIMLRREVRQLLWRRRCLEIQIGRIDATLNRVVDILFS